MVCKPSQLSVENGLVLFPGLKRRRKETWFHQCDSGWLWSFLRSLLFKWFKAQELLAGNFFLMDSVKLKQDYATRNYGILFYTLTSWWWWSQPHCLTSWWWWIQPHCLVLTSPTFITCSQETRLGESRTSSPLQPEHLVQSVLLSAVYEIGTTGTEVSLTWIILCPIFFSHQTESQFVYIVHKLRLDPAC